ncbi:MAG TPA: protein phosphatase 2C domain-containing protein, partial [Chloroflexia bacterium]|nr:protein phosphatase 2C domain-containing protein [Chloroflexia bacterium]
MEIETDTPTYASAEAQVEELAAPTTEPLEPDASASGPTTTPLADLEDQPLTPLHDGTLVGGRYEVMSLLAGGRDANIYRVIDKQGHKRCWACGAESSMDGDVYCVECGAQLSGRYYRMQEFRVPAGQDATPAIPVPQPILDNFVPGVARVYDQLEAPESSRRYVVWEEVYGRTLSAWLPDAPVADFTGALEEPGEEQAITWMAQAAAVLAQMHAVGVAGCVMDADNLLVQPGDRLLLLDPTSCRDISGASEQERAGAETSDVRNLATELERWYLLVRKGLDTPQDTRGEDDDAISPYSFNGSEMMVAADEATGPLASSLSPAVVLAKAREGAYPTAEAFAQAFQEVYQASRPLTNLQLWSGRATDVGQVRQINEDSVLTLEATVLEHEGNLPVGLYVVADGMGGHQSGEVASSIAARTIGGIINSSLIAPIVAGDPVARDANTCAALLRQAVLEANRRISDLARERHSDLGTTVVAALVIGNQVSVANVGDSRAYVWHDEQATPITRDHSLVAQLVAAGQITQDEVYTHPRRNEIYRALGDARLTDIDVDIFNHRLQPGDGL